MRTRRRRPVIQMARSTIALADGQISDGGGRTASGIIQLEEGEDETATVDSTPISDQLGSFN